MAYYSLEMAFPKFFEAAPGEATRALVEAIGGEVEREHSPRGGATEFLVAFEYLGTKVAFTSDESAIWGQSVFEESSLKLLSWWLHNLVDLLKAGRLAQSTLDELFKTLASGNPSTLRQVSRQAQYIASAEQPVIPPEGNRFR